MKDVSTLSMSRAMQDSDVETYAIVIKEVEDHDGVGMPILAKISNVLAKYVDLMPDELPKVLLPRCAVDHHIELDLGKQTLAKVPYRLSRMELEELK